MGDKVKNKAKAEIVGREIETTPIGALILRIAPLVAITEVVTRGTTEDPPKVFDGVGIYQAKESVIARPNGAQQELELTGVQVPIAHALAISEAFEALNGTPAFEALKKKLGPKLGVEVRQQRRGTK